MQTLRFRHTAKRRLSGKKDKAIIGVVASGNLEVLLERVLLEAACEVDIATRGGAAGHCLPAPDAGKCANGGRMMEDAATSSQASWFQATARQRVAGLLDPNSFTEFLGPSERVQSPHLHLFDVPSAFDDGVVIGRGKLDGKDVLVAAQEGQFMGGTFAEVSGAKLVGLVRAARDHRNLPQTVLLLMEAV
jgi:Carboxyl transferase domain